jgi:hypothetical protein
MLFKTKFLYKILMVCMQSLFQKLFEIKEFKQKYFFLDHI